MTCGIYKIVNRVNGKYYLGSSVNIKKRWKTHRCDLRHNRHHCIHLQRAWNKYGEKSFIFEIVEEVNKKILLEKEQYHLDTYTPWNVKVGYNMSKSASGGDLISYHPNIDGIKEKQRVATQRRWDMKTEEEKSQYAENMCGESNPNWRGGTTFYTCPICGVTIRKWTKSKNSCSKCRDRNGKQNPFFGKTHSNKTRKKISKMMIERNRINNTNKIKIQVDGVIYDSFTEASKKLNCAVASIRNRLNNPIKFPNYKLITQQ